MERKLTPDMFDVEWDEDGHAVPGKCDPVGLLAVMAEAMMAIGHHGIARTVKPGEVLYVKLDEHWSVFANPHGVTAKAEAVEGQMAPDELPPLSFQVNWHGWAWGILTPAAAAVAVGEVANTQRFVTDMLRIANREREETGPERAGDILKRMAEDGEGNVLSPEARAAVRDGLDGKPTRGEGG